MVSPVIIKLLARQNGVLREVTLHVTQMILSQDNGTPLSAASEYGPEGAQQVACVGCDPAGRNDELHRILRSLGETTGVVVDDLVLPPPPTGARLVAGPNVKRGNPHGRRDTRGQTRA